MVHTHQGKDLPPARDGTVAYCGVLGLCFDLQQRGSAEEALALVCKDSGLGEKCSSVVRQGGIYHEVLEEAKTFGCDIIVMSSHRPAMKTYFLGSNAGHMVRYAKCSVLVVRKPAL